MVQTAADRSIPVSAFKSIHLLGSTKSALAQHILGSYKSTSKGLTTIGEPIPYKNHYFIKLETTVSVLTFVKSISICCVQVTGSVSGVIDTTMSRVCIVECSICESRLQEMSGDRRGKK